MAYPEVTILPLSPSRVSDPDNFVNESSVFLTALPSFVTETNVLVDYVNTRQFDYNNYGTLSDINPTIPTLPTSFPSATGSGVQYVSGLDATMLAIQQGSVLVNQVGAYVDDVIAVVGIDDPDGAKPNITTLNPAPTRAMIRDVFNTTSITFTSSLMTSIQSSQTALNYIANKVFGEDDYGFVTENNTETNDFGVL